jgi:PAS domain S-box-containing protein
MSILNVAPLSGLPPYSGNVPILIEGSIAAIPAPILVHDTRRFLAVNDGAIQFYGFSQAEFLTMAVSDLEVALDADRAILQHRRKDGTPVAIRLSSKPVLYDRRQAWCSAVSDMTDYVALERAVGDGETRFAQLLDADSQWCYELDAAMRFTYLSANVERIFGIDSKQLHGQALVDLPEVKIDPESAVVAFGALRARQPFRDLTFAVPSADGHYAKIVSHGTPIFDAQGKLLGYRGIAKVLDSDFDSLEVARRRLLGVLELMPQPGVTWTNEGRVLAFNGAFVRLHGTADRQALRGDALSLSDLIAWQHDTRLYVDESGAPMSVEQLHLLYRTRDDVTCRLADDRWLVLSQRELAGGLIIGLWLDITALKQAEEARRKLEDQLHHAQRLEALGTLAGGIAHEINNAMVPVLAMTKRVAAKLPDSSQERRHLGIALEGIAKTRDLVNQIVGYANSRRDEQTQESFDLAATIEDAMRLLRATLPSTIQIEQRIASVPPLLGHPGQLQQALINMVINAAQAIQAQSPTGTISLTLDVAEGEGAVRLSVADTGCGMDEATLGRIFDPFFTTREVGQGTGLGLALVHAVVKSHDGRIEVSSEPGKGSRFDILLPFGA